MLNYIFALNMPAQALMYLVVASGTYMISQGYVDAKQTNVTTFPVDDVTNAVSDIIQSQMQKTGFGNNLPMETIVELVKTVLKQELSKLFVTPEVVSTDPVDPNAAVPL